MRKYIFILIFVMSIFYFIPFVSSVDFDCVAYWNMTNTTNTLIPDLTVNEFNLTRIISGNYPQEVPGRLGTGQYNFTGNQASGWINITGNLTRIRDLNSSYSSFMWVNVTSTTANPAFIYTGINGWQMGITDTSNGYFGFGQFAQAATAECSIDIQNSTWNHVGFVVNSTNGVLVYVNGQNCVNGTKTFDPTSSTGAMKIGADPPGILALDEIGIWDRALTPTDIAELYNSGSGLEYNPIGSITVELLAPADNDKLINTTINFTSQITFSIPNTINVTNVTLYIYDGNGSLKETNTTITSRLDTFNFSVSETGFVTGNDYLWNLCVMTNNSGDCSWATSNFSFTSSTFTETSFNFVSSVLETSRQNYSLRIGALSNVNSVAANLYYNGTKYTATVTDLGSNNYDLNRTIDVPLNNVTSNKTHFWELIFTLNGGTTVNLNSTVQTQEVNRTYLYLCNATYNVPYINISTFNAENPFPALNATLKSAWSWFVQGGGTINRIFAFEDVSETNKTFDFCMADSSTNYSVSSTIEIDGAAFAKNFHFLEDATLTNVTTNLSLYLLNDSKATATVLEVKDGKQDPLQDVLVSIQFYDVGTDTFYTVGMAKTSSEGEDLVYLNWYDSLYKFVFVQNGTTIKTTTPYKITETPQIFEIVTETVFEFAKFDDFDYQLYYNSTTQNFVLTFVKPSGSVDSGCLRVIKRNVTNDYLICHTCETSTSATVYCSIANEGNGTFIGTFYATGSLKVVDTISTVVGTINEIYEELGNETGTVLAIIFAGLIMTFFLITPVLGVIGLLLGMLGAYSLGFQPIDYGVFIGLVIIGGVVIWLLKR